MKNFKKMTSKQLIAELANASKTDAAEIKTILTNRGVEIEETQEAQSEEAQPTQPAQSAQSEEAQPTQPAQPKVKKVKMTDEELTALANECKKNVNHRCEVVPFNTIEWKKGVIAGVIEDKRSNKVLYGIKLDDGRRIVKACDSQLLKISEDVIEKAVSKRSSSAEKLSDEQLDELFAELCKHVGCKVTLDELTGRITALVKDKRNNKVLYKITLDNGATSYRVSSSPLTIEELDEEGAAINKKYMERVNVTPVSLEEKIKLAEQAVKKAEALLASKQEILAKLKEKFIEQATEPARKAGDAVPESEDDNLL